MTKTKYTGVYHHIAKDGTKTFHIRGKIKGKNYTEVIGSTKEGITAVYASNMRAKKHGIIKLGEDSPLHTITVYTLNESSELYFEKIKHKSNTPNAKAVYAKHIEKHHIGNLPLREITTNDLELLKSAKLDEKILRTVKGKIIDTHGKTYSKSTVNKIIDLISAIFTYMNKSHSVHIENPARGVERYRVDNRRERYLETREIRELLEAIRGGNGRKKKMLELFTMLALSTGARLTSILTITKSDINLKTGHITLKDYKRDMTYTGYIHDSVRPLLDETMKSMRTIDHIIGGKAQAMDKANINKMLQPLLNRLFNDGLERHDAKRRAVIHSLRHTFASHLAISGTPIFTIQKLLNHKEIEQTMRYAKLAPDQGSEDVQGIKI